MNQRWCRCGHTKEQHYTNNVPYGEHPESVGCVNPERCPGHAARSCDGCGCRCTSFSPKGGKPGAAHQS